MFTLFHVCMAYGKGREDTLGFPVTLTGGGLHITPVAPRKKGFTSAPT